eukprot:PhM_4_TR16111/c0_g1_i1/m.84880
MATHAHGAHRAIDAGVQERVLHVEVSVLEEIFVPEIPLGHLGTHPLVLAGAGLVRAQWHVEDALAQLALLDHLVKALAARGAREEGRELAGRHVRGEADHRVTGAVDGDLGGAVDEANDLEQQTLRGAALHTRGGVLAAHQEVVNGVAEREEVAGLETVALDRETLREGVGAGARHLCKVQEKLTGAVTAAEVEPVQELAKVLGVETFLEDDVVAEVRHVEQIADGAHLGQGHVAALFTLVVLGADTQCALADDASTAAVQLCAEVVVLVGRAAETQVLHDRHVVAEEKRIGGCVGDGLLERKTGADDAGNVEALEELVQRRAGLLVGLEEGGLRVDAVVRTGAAVLGDITDDLDDARVDLGTPRVLDAVGLAAARVLACERVADERGLTEGAVVIGVPVGDDDDVVDLGIELAEHGIAQEVAESAQIRVAGTGDNGAGPLAVRRRISRLEEVVLHAHKDEGGAAAADGGALLVFGPLEGAHEDVLKVTFGDKALRRAELELLNAGDHVEVALGRTFDVKGTGQAARAREALGLLGAALALQNPVGNGDITGTHGLAEHAVLAHGHVGFDVVDKVLERVKAAVAGGDADTELTHAVLLAILVRVRRCTTDVDIFLRDLVELHDAADVRGVADGHSVVQEEDLSLLTEETEEVLRVKNDVIWQLQGVQHVRQRRCLGRAALHHLRKLLHDAIRALLVGTNAFKHGAACLCLLDNGFVQTTGVEGLLVVVIADVRLGLQEPGGVLEVLDAAQRDKVRRHAVVAAVEGVRVWAV